jgi:hypothetical protein
MREEGIIRKNYGHIGLAENSLKSILIDLHEVIVNIKRRIKIPLSSVNIMGSKENCANGMPCFYYLTHANSFS